MEWLRELLQLVAPERCHGCGRDMTSLADPEPFCAKCFESISAANQPSCLRCGAPIEIDGHLPIEGCRACFREKLAFQKCWRFGAYDGDLRNLVLRCKRQGGEILAESVGFMMGKALSRQVRISKPHALVAVPSHWTKRLARGHNPALGLAKGISRFTGIACQSRWLFKKRRSPSQTSLPPSLRKKLGVEMFQATIPQANQGCAIWLVDDVLTTGATASACASALLKAGAREVVPVVLARGG